LVVTFPTKQRLEADVERLHSRLVRLIGSLAELLEQTKVMSSGEIVDTRMRLSLVLVSLWTVTHAARAVEGDSETRLDQWRKDLPKAIPVGERLPPVLSALCQETNALLPSVVALRDRLVRALEHEEKQGAAR
jgi:hypothetical protein